MRIASLAHPAADNVFRFREVLARVGWSPGRIARAEHRVRWGLLAPLVLAAPPAVRRAGRLMKARPGATVILMALLASRTWMLATLLLLVLILFDEG